MSSWRYEVQAAVYSGIRDAFLASDVDFFLQKFLVLFIDVFRYGLPARHKKGKYSMMLHVESYARAHETLKQQMKNQTRPNSLFGVQSLKQLE